MKSISKLKDEARRYEQREEWEKAIQTYLHALKVADEGDAEVDLALYNRLGDLCVRLGRPQEAMRHYEQAADRYAEAGLYNNAIALCNKALRYSPDRLELIRKLGQFSASQGFITDARRYFLDYAERQFRAGKVTDALTALEDFANVSDDAEVREMLGRQLHAHGRTNEAIDELRRAHAMRLGAGETQIAEELRQEILSIDPHAPVDGAAPPRPSQRVHEPGSDLPGLVEIEPEPEPESFETPAYEETDVSGLETGALPGDVMDTIEVSGYEAMGEPVLEDVDVGGTDAIEGLETTTFDFGEVDDTSAVADEGFDLPLLGDDEEESTPLPTLEVDEPKPALDLPEPETPTDYDPLAGDLRIDLNALGFTFPGTEPEPTAEPELPADEPPAEEPVASEPPREEPVAAAVPVELPAIAEPEPIAEEPTEAATDLPLLEPEPTESIGEPVLEESVGGIDVPAIELPTWDTDPAVEPVEEAADSYEAAWVDTSGVDEEESAIDLPTFTYEDEEDVTPETELVEDDDPLGLAAHLSARTPPVTDRPPAQAVEQPPPAEPVVEPQLEAEGAADTDWLDEIADDEPAQWEQTPAGATVDGEAADDADVPAAEVEDVAAESEQAAKASAEMPPSPPKQSDFIDLGALLADDQSKHTTRFRVQETAPTGDEDRDFAELLNQFRLKVQEHVPPDDAAAHYDLGLAFKDMGLIDEAIAEFQVSLRAGPMRLKVYEELGQCFMLKEQYNIAEKVLKRALEMKFDDELELLGVYYHLGRAYEALGRKEQARDAYERVLGMDINFEDVTARLARL